MSTANRPSTGFADNITQEDTFVREGFETDGKAYERGIQGLDRVYKHNSPKIQQRMLDLGLRDIQWLGPAVTYGQLLGVTRPEHPSASLTFSETEIIVLTCLMARHAHRCVPNHSIRLTASLT